MISATTHLSEAMSLTCLTAKRNAVYLVVLCGFVMDAAIGNLKLAFEVKANACVISSGLKQQSILFC
jgi:hypothetical protein